MAQQPSQKASGCPSKPGRGQGLPHAWEQAGLLRAPAPLGQGCHKAFQNLQTPGQGQAQGPGRNFLHRHWLHNGQVPTCLCSVGRTGCPSRLETEGLKAEAGYPIWGGGVGVQGSLQTAAIFSLPLGSGSPNSGLGLSLPHPQGEALGRGINQI